MPYKAFVSSTYVDLKDHRARVIQTLRRAGVTVDPMEDWTADGNEPKRFSQDRLEACDLCILLVAFRRGFVPPGENHSITQLEYQSAVRRGIDILPFLLDDASPWHGIYDERKSDPDINQWREQIRNQFGVETFGLDPASLDVGPAVIRWLQKKKEQQRRKRRRKASLLAVIRWLQKKKEPPDEKKVPPVSLTKTPDEDAADGRHPPEGRSPEPRPPGKRRGWLGALSGLICGVAVWLVLKHPLAGALEEWMLDRCFQVRGIRETRANVVIIDIDEQSLLELEGRKALVQASQEIADVVRFANEQGAKAIGLDVIIDENVRDRPDLAEGPLKLGNVIKKNRIRAVFAECKVSGHWVKPLPQWRLAALANPKSTDLGFVNLSEDRDNFVRRQQLLFKDAGKLHFHFALALYAAALGEEITWKEHTLLVEQELVPLDSEGQLRINFVGPPNTFKIVPFRDALHAARERIPVDAEFKDAIVIFGKSGGDLHPTPYSNKYWGNSADMSGAELHANIVATLSDHAFIVPFPRLPLSSLPMLLLSGTVLGVGFEQLNRLRSPGVFFFTSVVLLFALGVLWEFVCVEALRRGPWQLDVLPVFFLALFACAANLGVRWLTLRRMVGELDAPMIK